MANSNRDYYAILGLSKGASINEVKKAYRKLAREHHPDVAKDKEAAEVRFKEINEAYQVLSDPGRKKMYDQYGHVGRSGGGGGFDPFGFGGTSGQSGPFTYTYTSSAGNNFDPFEVFEQFFGFRGFGGRPLRGKNLYYSLTIEFVDVIKGVEQNISIGGRKLKVKVPAGVRDGTELRFEGEGEPGPRGTPSGDLFLTVRVMPHREFKRFGNDLFVLRELSITQAILGDSIMVPVINASKKDGISEVKLKIPAGTQPGTDFRLKGKGLPVLRGRGRGDVYVRVKVRIPEKITKRQKELLREFNS